MKKLYLKNYKKQHIYNYTEKKRLILRYLLKSNKNYTSDIIQNNCYNTLFNNSKINFHTTSFTTRCVLTNRARSVYRKVKMSRLMLKQNILKGALPGFIKASW